MSPAQSAVNLTKNSLPTHLTFIEVRDITPEGQYPELEARRPWLLKMTSRQPLDTIRVLQGDFRWNNQNVEHLRLGAADGRQGGHYYLAWRSRY